MLSLFQWMFRRSGIILAILASTLSISHVGHSRAIFDNQTSPTSGVPLRHRTLIARSDTSTDYGSDISVGVANMNIALQPWMGATWKLFIPQTEAWGEPTIHSIAKRAYDQLGMPRSEVFIVAALWIPNIGCYLSSIPRDETITQYFTANGARDAPRWWREVAFRTNHGSGSLYHAEDGACFLYEQSIRQKISGGAFYPSSGGQRPYMYAYGVRSVGYGPMYEPPCLGDQGGRITPDCETVLRRLGIETPIH